MRRSRARVIRANNAKPECGSKPPHSNYFAETMFANNRYAPATPAGSSRNQS